MNRVKVLSLGLTAAALAGLGACAGAVTVPVDVNLDDALGGFEVQAGVPTQNSGTVNIDTQGLVGGASLELDLDSLVVNPTDAAAKSATAASAATNTVDVTVYIAPAANLATVCGGEGSETYGPFRVTLDADFVPVSIEPSTVTLSSTTIGLLNGGQFALCVNVLATFDGEVTIQTIRFNVSL